MDVVMYSANHLVNFIGPPMGYVLEGINNKMIENNVDKKDIMQYLPVVLLVFYAFLVMVLLIIFRFQLFYRKRRPKTKKIEAIATEKNKLENSTTITSEQKKKE